MGHSGKLKPGEWVVAMGHPGGFQRNRLPPARAGRLVMVRSDTIWTDCPLTAGDSARSVEVEAGRAAGRGGSAGATAGVGVACGTPGPTGLTGTGTSVAPADRTTSDR